MILWEKKIKDVQDVTLLKMCGLPMDRLRHINFMETNVSMILWAKQMSNIQNVVPINGIFFVNIATKYFFCEEYLYIFYGIFLVGSWNYSYKKPS